VTSTGPATSQPRRWWRWVAIALAAAVLLLAAWSPSRVTFQTLALIPSLVQVGPNPLGLAPAPTHEVTSYTAPDGTELPADLWLPASASADRPVGAGKPEKGSERRRGEAIHPVPGARVGHHARFTLGRGSCHVFGALALSPVLAGYVLQASAPVRQVQA